MAGGSVYMLLRRQAIGGAGFGVSLYRIPYRYLYRTAPSYFHVIGSPAPAVITAKRTSADRLTYDRFRRLDVDGVTVDPKHYRTARGSLVLTLSPAYLDTLSPGKHPAVLHFADGTAETELIITRPVPRTGDTAAPVRWILCVCLGLIVLAFLFRRKRSA